MHFVPKMIIYFLFTDIATGIGFYAVSIPFFDKSNKLLTDNADGERLRVCIDEKKQHSKNFMKSTSYSIITRLVECW